MRITVGGVLLVVGAGAFVALGPVPRMDSSFVNHQVESIRKSLEDLRGLFKKGSADEASPVPVEKESLPVVEKPPEPLSVPVVESQPPEKVEEAVVPVVVPEVPHSERVAAAIKRHRPRNRPSKRQGGVLTNAADKAAVGVVAVKPSAIVKETENMGSDPLMGSYVALKLKTGREVKGVLRGKTAKLYTLELPGMGPFQYPAENVVGVTPAE